MNETNDHLIEIIELLRNISQMPLIPEWVKLIPADSIPVFCFNENLLDSDMAIICDQLKEFFGERKFLAMRGGAVQIYAIEDKRDE